MLCPHVTCALGTSGQRFPAAFLGILLLWPSGTYAQSKIRQLPAPGLGQSQELALPPAETHRWTFNLRVGEFVSVKVLQIGIDVVLRVRKPTGTVQAEFDSPNGPMGREAAAWITDSQGTWTVEVAPFDPARNGRYRLTFVEERAARLGDSTRITLSDSARRLVAQAIQAPASPAKQAQVFASYQRAISLYEMAGERDAVAEMLTLESQDRFFAGQHDTSAALARAAIPLWRSARDAEGEGRALRNLGLAFSARGMHDSAIVYVRRAALAFHEEALPLLEAEENMALGTMFESLGEPDSALKFYRNAITLVRHGNGRNAEGHMLVTLGKLLAQIGHADSALGPYRQALIISREEQDSLLEGRTLARLAHAFGTIHLRDSALVYYYQALNATRVARDTISQLGVLSSLGNMYLDDRPDSAFALLGEALRIADAAQNAPAQYYTLSNVGDAHNLLGAFDSTLRYYHRALDIATGLGDPHRKAMTRLMISRVYFALGRFDSAAFHAREGRTVAQESGDRAAVGDALSQLGRLHREVGRSDSAITYHREALRIAQGLGNPLQSADELDNMGINFTSSHQADSALKYHALALGARSAARDVDGQALTLTALAMAHASIGDVDSARALLDRAGGAVRQVQDRSLDERGAITNLGEMLEHASAGQAESTLAYDRRLLTIVRGMQTNQMGEARLLAVIGELFQTLDDPARAVAYFDSSATLFAPLREHAGEDADRLVFGEGLVQLFQRWSLAWLARSPAVGVNRAMQAALAVTERGRAKALLDLMRWSSRDAVETRGLGTVLTPAGADLSGEADVLLASLRRTHTASLIYLVTPDTLVTWLLAPSGDLQVRSRVAARDSLARLVESLRGGLGADSARGRMARGADDRPREQEQGVGVGTTGADAFTVAAAQLGDLLLPADFFASLPPGTEVVLLPHDLLGLVPFAALPVANGGTLGERYALRYAPSLAALNAAEAAPATSRGAGRNAMSQKSLIVGNPTMPSVQDTAGTPVQLESLDGAEEEARSIATRLKTTALTGSAATEEAVRARLNGVSLIHLATHGLAYGSEAQVRSSYVALAPGGGHDGLFTLGELLDDEKLRLQAELVVLSACQTGLGDMKQAEGTVGLQRAYLAKGARTVLVSLWSVADDPTRLLMERFYAHWLAGPGGPSKAEALRRAQNDVRTTSGYEHPRFWAGFQLVGAR